MNTGNPYQGLPIQLLKELRDTKVANIERERNDLEKLELIIRSVENPEMGGLLTVEDQRQLLTTGGTMRDITGWAIKILGRRGFVMTASEIAEVMYSYSWSIDLRAFKRRVIVAVSAEANMKDGGSRVVLSGLRAPNREVRWALPNWINDGALLPQYEPKVPTMGRQ